MSVTASHAPGAQIVDYTVASGETIVAGDIVKASSGEAAQCGDGEAPIGVAMQSGSAGDVIPVCVGGYCEVTAAAAIDKGVLIASDANARAVAAASTDAYLGVVHRASLASSGGVHSRAWVYVNISGAVAP